MRLRRIEGRIFRSEDEPSGVPALSGLPRAARGSRRAAVRRALRRSNCTAGAREIRPSGLMRGGALTEALTTTGGLIFLAEFPAYSTFNPVNPVKTMNCAMTGMERMAYDDCSELP